MLKRTLLVALIVGLSAVGIAKPTRKSRKAPAQSHTSSKARVSRKAETRNGKRVRKKVVPYRIQPGDNDWKIAKKTGLSVKELRHLNGGKKLGMIRAGATLNIAKFVAAKKSAPKRSTSGVSSSRRRTVTTKRTAPTRSARRSYVASASKRRTAPKTVNAPKRVISSTKPAPTPKAATIPATATPASTPGPITTVVANTVRTTGRGTVDGILQKANTFRGVRYRYGAMSRSATDCSGFTSQVFRANGYRIPRTSAEQSKVGARVSRGDLAPGDLVFFRTVRGTRVSHVGIYVGGNRFIHASSGGGRVMVSSLGEGYYNNRYVGARRVAKGGIVQKVVQTAVEAEKTQQVPLDPEPRQSASDVVGN